jgi:hypothetical protein
VRRLRLLWGGGQLARVRGVGDRDGAQIEDTINCHSAAMK